MFFILTTHGYVVNQFWVKCYFTLFLGMLMHANEFEMKENKIVIKEEIEPELLLLNLFLP